MPERTAIEIERERDARRQARRRERMRAEGKPLTHVVDRVLLESLSFELARTPMPHDGDAVVSVPALLKTARKILSRREGYDKAASRMAILGRLAARAEHNDPDFIPSLHPDAGVPVQERARRRAERDVVQPK